MRLLPVLALLLGCPPAKPDLGDDGDDTGLPTATTAPWGIETRPVNETCLAAARPPTGATVRFTRVWSALDFSVPVAMVPAPGADGAWYVVEQGGRVLRVPGDPDATEMVEVLDLSDRVSRWSGNEDGLLGLAVHPDFDHNGEIVVNYTAGSGDGSRSVVSRFTSRDGGLSFDPDGEDPILEVSQPYVNHNGGHVLFGPDGHLYVGFGDGGSAGDPDDNGQNPHALLGKMLRLDVDGGTPYAIPADNPYADGVDGAPEVYALGLRNPWRYSFDRESGALWVGDVGQDTWEEVDVVERGGNYGWNVKEGAHCYPRGEDCPGPYLDPVAEYSHAEGDSITGGVVYRGSAIPELVGTYLYADAYQGKVWGLFFDEAGAPAPALLGTLTGFPVHFGEGPDGEVHLVDFLDGNVYRLDPAGEPAEDTFPRLLSETGCVDPDDPTRPAPGLIPYTVNSPLWSDGAEKARWFAVPDGTTIDLAADGTFELPVGSVVVKQFVLGDQRVETRLLMRHDDGEWAGYSYAWNETGTDAELLAADRTVEVDGQSWTHPSRSQCLQCHTSAAGRLLGLRLDQLNGPYLYEGGAFANQLATLDHLGLFTTSPGDPAGIEALPDPLDTDDPEAAARSYVAANCSFCHRPDGSGGGGMDLRWEAEDTNTCGEAPVNGDLGVADAQIVWPGHPELSVLSLRLHALDAHRMPPLGSGVVDEAGTAVVDGWISALTSCE